MRITRRGLCIRYVLSKYLFLHIPSYSRLKSLFQGGYLAFSFEIAVFGNSEVNEVNCLDIHEAPLNAA